VKGCRRRQCHLLIACLFDGRACSHRLDTAATRVLAAYPWMTAVVLYAVVLFMYACLGGGVTSVGRYPPPAAVPAPVVTAAAVARRHCRRPSLHTYTAPPHGGAAVRCEWWWWWWGGLSNRELRRGEEDTWHWHCWQLAVTV